MIHLPPTADFRRSSRIFEPNIYTTEWLKKARDDHYLRVEKALKEHDIEPIDLNIEVNLSFKKVFQIWEANKKTKNEEFWQQLFTKNPRILSQVSPNCICQIGSKCYLGGKSLNNKGGNLIDFLYANSITENVCLIEIKTPATDLIGPKYRTNAFSISHELSGAIIQVLNYRDELLKNYFSLIGQDLNNQFSAFNPKCIVIAGCFELQNLSPSERKSFELFRSNSYAVEIVTYDELFLKIKDIIELIE